MLSKSIFGFISQSSKISILIYRCMSPLSFSLYLWSSNHICICVYIERYQTSWFRLKGRSSSKLLSYSLIKESLSANQSDLIVLIEQVFLVCVLCSSSSSSSSVKETFTIFCNQEFFFYIFCIRQCTVCASFIDFSRVRLNNLQI